MVRRYDEQVDVQVRAGGPGEPDEPVAFVWRGRVHVVRAVLGRWYERRAWWREGAAMTLLGLRGDRPRAGTASAGGTRSVGALVEDPVDDRLFGSPEAEREVWRVEAAAGRSSPLGVYELVRDPQPTDGADPVSQGGSWRLASIDD